MALFLDTPRQSPRNLTVIAQIIVVVFLLGQWSAEVAAQNKLQKLQDCRFNETDWCDGDSFEVEKADGTKFTLRLYGVDCIEAHVNDDSDARRLRSQRRYFGISEMASTSEASIEAAKRMACQARDFVIAELKEPFTVITAFADARGDGKYKRFYGFVTTSNGDDLAAKLVQMGHARALGVSRRTIDGRSRDEYREKL